MKWLNGPSQTETLTNHLKSVVYLFSIISCEAEQWVALLFFFHHHHHHQVRHLHTLGTASLHCPARVSQRTVLLVESVLTTHSDKLAGEQGVWPGWRWAWHLSVTCRWLLTGSEEELPASLPVSQFRSNSFTTRIRAHGVIALGKLDTPTHAWFYCEICRNNKQPMLQ